MARAVGDITRGTTNPNRLRRMDRWILHQVCSTIRGCDGTTIEPIVVDLGYGSSPITTVELYDRLAKHVRPDVEVVGIEIDPARVAEAKSFEKGKLRFLYGGFEIPLADAKSPIAIRAANVLRQYDEAEVQTAWEKMASRLAPNGYLIEGTCDEIGRRSSWVSLRAGAKIPESFTISVHVGSLAQPSDIAPRLPKALIHRNIPGEPVHDFLQAFDRVWHQHAGLIPFGARQRWVGAVESLVELGYPVWDNKTRWRLGEVTVPWSVVAPTSYLD
jgi:hypothetical protein